MPETKIEYCAEGHAVATHGGVVIQVFASEARQGTIDRATDALRRIRRATGKGAGALILVMHDGRPPDDACRRAWARQLREAEVGSTLILYEASSLRAAIVRGVVTGLLLLVRRSPSIHVAAAARDGLPWFVGQLEAQGAELGGEAALGAALAEAREKAVASAASAHQRTLSAM
jgi:hypothetical protein